MKRLIKCRIVSILAICALALSGNAQTDTTSGVRGQVVDSAGSPIAGARIIVTHEPTNSINRTTANENGRYDVGGLRPGGPYTVVAEADGFQSTEIRNLSLGLGSESRANITLQGGGDVVDLEAFVVEADDSNVGVDLYGPAALLTRDGLDNAPSATESLADVVRLNGFVTIGDTERGEINAVGQHYRQNSIQIDGVNFNDQFGLESGGLPSLNNPVSLRSIEQLNVDVAPYAVTKSGFTGASVNAVTKSGTNEFSGSLYYYYSDEEFRGENLNTGEEEPYEETTYGFTLGGPILKDKIFFFVSYEEFERNQLPGDPGFIPDPAAVEQVRQRLLNISTNAYPSGYDPGTWGSLETSKEEDEKLLAKVDWQINDQHRFTVRYSLTEATEPDFGEYTDNGETALTSHFFDVDYETESFAGELNSNWSDNFETQIIFAHDTYDKTPTYRNTNLIPEMHIRDFPGTDLNGSASTGRLYFGSEDSRQANSLEVETTKAKAIGKYKLEKHTLTFGADMEETKFDNLFLQDVYGDISFRTSGGISGLDNFLDPNFEVGRRITRRTGVQGLEIAAQSDYTITGLFFQTEWVISPKFDILLGVRGDFMEVDQKPTKNETFSNNFVSFDGRGGWDNSNTIDGTEQIAPRFGFRFKPGDDRNSVIRGGFGLFQGKVPGVYMSNAYSNNGVTTGSIRYDSSTTLQQYLDNEFDPANPILFLPEPSGANIDVIDPDFELPAIWRANIAYEMDLPWHGFRFTAELIQSYTERGVLVEQLNLKPMGTAPDGRALYGGSPFFGNGNDDDYGDVYNLKNTDDGEATNILFKVARPWADQWMVSASYTYGSSEDVSSVTSSTAFSNYANRAVFNQNEDVSGRSNYEIRHKVLIQAGYEFQWNDKNATRFVIVYEGRTGRPYSWVFKEDFNNDGIDDNDLFYVPTGENDPMVGFANGTSQADIDAFFAFIDSTSLSAYRGQVTPRNSETSSYIHRFDINITHSLMITDRVELELFANFINVGNMIDDEWGVTNQIPFSFTRGVVEASVENDQIIYDLSTPDSSRIDSARSRWQVRFGATLKF